MPQLSSEVAGQTLTILEKAFRRLEQQVPMPRPVPFKDSFVLRYSEKSTKQALIQKLARVVSALHAAWLLNRGGFVQEQGVIQRTLDELHEDVTFLAAAIANGALTDQHKKYLEAFYEEEFSPIDGKPLKRRKRYMTPRAKIQSYIARIFGLPDPSSAIDSTHAISKVYSGFVHGSSPHIMDMCGGNPPKFHISGMVGTPRVAEYRADLWNYFFRSLLTIMMVAKAFGDEKLLKELDKYRDEFEAISGTSYKSRDG